MNDQMPSFSRPIRKSIVTNFAGLLLGAQVSGCAIPDLVGRDPTADEKSEIKELVHNEIIYRDIVGQLVMHSDVEMTDIWGGTIKSNEVAMDHFGSEVGDNLLDMLREDRIRVFSGEEFFGGAKEDSVAFFNDTPISTNTEDGYVFLNTDLRDQWTTGVLVHEVLHSPFGDHSNVVKEECFSGNTFSASNSKDLQCIIDELDTPTMYKVLYDVAQAAIEKDQNQEFELFFDIDWSDRPNAVFDALELEEQKTQQEWAEDLASRTYSVTSTILNAFGVDRDEFIESLANSEKAWESHQELLAEIRIEVENEYLAEAKAELEERERQQEAREETMQEGAENANKISESGHREQEMDGYRIKRV